MSEATDCTKLLALIFQGGEIKVEKGQILIRPASLAQRLAPQIKARRGDLLLALGYCPVCAEELRVKVHTLSLSLGAKTVTHTWCPTPGHYDKW